MLKHHIREILIAKQLRNDQEIIRKFSSLPHKIS